MAMESNGPKKLQWERNDCTLLVLFLGEVVNSWYFPANQTGGLGFKPRNVQFLPFLMLKLV
jgi:hypothetical protein